MKQLLCCFLMFILLSGCAPAPSVLEEAPESLPETIEAPEPIAGVWVSYLDLYPEIAKGKEAVIAFTAKIVEKAAAHRLNTVILQLRAFGDASYPSAYFPPADCMEGIDFDPAAILITALKDAGLRVEGWINPMRCKMRDEILSGEESVIKEWTANDENVFVFEERVYFDPASEKARELIAEGAREILENYPLDGLHIDDYFYPQGALADPEAVTELVRLLYGTVKEVNPALSFGVSPRGVFSQNLSLGADIECWISEGIVDYLAPQIYFGFCHQTAPFGAELNRWQEAVTHTNIPLIIGLAAYKLGNEDPFAEKGRYEWIESEDILSRQIAAVTKAEHCGGYLLFRLAFLP